MKIALYILATFLETGLGIHIFAQAFPKREYMGKKQIAAEGILIVALILVSCSFWNFYGLFENRASLQEIFVESSLGIILCFVIQKVKTKGKNEKSCVPCILLYWSILTLGCQYWSAYESLNLIVTANLLPVLYLYVFYRCTFLQAYLWELCYLVNIGFIKSIFVIYSGVFRERNFEGFFYYPRNHTYGEIVYWLTILGSIFLIDKYACMNEVLKEILYKYKKMLLVITSAELCIIGLVTNMGKGRAKEQDLAEVLIIFGMFVVFLIILLIRLSKQMQITEKKVFEVRNAAVEQQYIELNRSYEYYRHLVHDEKHILCYLKECLETGKAKEALAFIENSQKSIADRSRSFWTGITTLDFMLNIKKRKMDSVHIEFFLEAKVSEIPMEDADFIVALGNLLDNAIEAAEQCQKENRKIWMSSQNINEMFLMTLKNTCETQPVEKNNKFVTHKKNADRHGLGVESVRRIMDKYQGEISFDYKSGFFEVSIIITQ